MKHGNFTGLASRYSAYRPKYSDSVLKALLALHTKSVAELNMADVGAGTGIWTRMLASANPKSIVAVEPNDDMRTYGEKDSVNTKIKWLKGSGEETGLHSGSLDLVSMASSFHWVNFENGCKEFHRVLNDNGRFIALWNPRNIQANPLIAEIEDYITFLKPDIVRVSSGRIGLVDNLTEKLYQTKIFDDVVYIEGRHTNLLSPADYIGAWRSVNDVQYQLGSEKFEEFITYATKKLSGVDKVEVQYLTRAWSAKKIN